MAPAGWLRGSRGIAAGDASATRRTPGQRPGVRTGGDVTGRARPAPAVRPRSGRAGAVGGGAGGPSRQRNGGGGQAQPGDGTRRQRRWCCGQRHRGGVAVAQRAGGASGGVLGVRGRGGPARDGEPVGRRGRGHAQRQRRRHQHLQQQRHGQNAAARRRDTRLRHNAAWRRGRMGEQPRIGRPGCRCRARAGAGRAAWHDRPRAPVRHRPRPAGAPGGSWCQGSERGSPGRPCGSRPCCCCRWRSRRAAAGRWCAARPRRRATRRHARGWRRRWPGCRRWPAATRRQACASAARRTRLRFPRPRAGWPRGRRSSTRTCWWRAGGCRSPGWWCWGRRRRCWAAWAGWRGWRWRRVAACARARRWCAGSGGCADWCRWRWAARWRAWRWRSWAWWGSRAPGCGSPTRCRAAS